MKYTEEQLMEMPMKFLRQLDIQNVDEEKLVQKVLNARFKDMPAVTPMNFSSSETDNLTVEKEKELQAKIDARNARLKAQLEGEEPESAPLPDPTEEDDEPLTPEADKTTTAIKAKFCNYCDSKGVRHKLACTRPNKPVSVS